MPEKRDNSGSLWPTREGAKCDFSGSAKVNGVDYKLFGNRDGTNRVFDFVGDGVRAQCVLTPITDRKHDRMPHYNGTVTLGDQDLEVAGWAKTVSTQYGEKNILSLKISKNDRQPQPAQPEVNDQDIPF